jgi:3-phenylpropionate/cinnamic acid dioxygenase small subunit
MSDFPAPSGSAMPSLADMDMPAIQWQVEQFLFREAQLIDDRQYEDWLEMLHPDLTYTMPLRVDRLKRDVTRYKGPPDQVMIFDDNYESIKVRVRRIRSGVCWADDPPARVRHAITNVQVRRADGADTLEVKSAFMVYVSRMEESGILFSGLRDDVIIQAGGRLLVARRQIMGDQTVMLSNNLTIFF